MSADLFLDFSKLTYYCGLDKIETNLSEMK